MKPIRFNIEEIKSLIENSSQTTAIYVGCDSRVTQKSPKGGKATYVTVVVVHMDGNKGARVFRDVQTIPDFNQLRVRLMNEVYFATNIAMELVDIIGTRPFEIHLDVNPNPNHKSSIVVKEATGYVFGVLGIKPKLKPDAFTASAVADHYT